MITISNSNHWLQEQTQKLGDKTAILFKGKSITYSKLLEESYNYANYLISAGIKNGDRIAVLIGHSPEFVFIINALWLIGAIPLLLNSRNSTENIEQQLAFVNPGSLIVDESTMQKFSLLKFRSILKIEDINNSGFSDSLLNSSSFILQNTSLLLFTSGSAGKPKCVVHTFESLYQSVLLTDSISKLNSEDKWLASLPLYHIGGFMIFIRSILSGSTLIFPDSVDHKGIANALRKYQPTHFSLVSTTLKQLINDNLKPNPELKAVFLGGGPLEKKLCSDTIINGFPIIKVYGSTETCSMITALSLEDFKNKPDSSGKPLGENEIRIADGKNQFIGTFRSGEIVVKSKSLFKEYYDNPEETNNKKRDGYFFTGDFGSIDDDGYLFVESRREDIVITGGENVSTREVVQFLIQLPAVKDAYVFSEADEIWGQIICAAIVADLEVSQIELQNQLRNMMPHFKIPKKIYFVERIPRNEMGKVTSETLKELLN